MFKKILVAEDFGGENLGIIQTLTEKLKGVEIQNELYCDKAYNRFKIAETNNIPFELLITDLHFKESLVSRKLSSGIELINAIKLIQPKIKVIVYSMVDNVTQINTLFKEQNINGYVCKGRHGLTELISAIYNIYQNKTYLSPQINLVDNDVFELDNFDLSILKELANGFNKKEIVQKFKEQNITPNSESTIDKKISKLFDHFEAKNTTHLISKLIKIGVL
ncbi:response regulator receiver protein [Flavivirga aquatica]|uniref:Response regulator receiver protein n=1 Tax=Flavivirga aquatica TaxID=1849968 RepID=A0A1E5TE67_9FLAO|nr:response regulator transcription factor [Flavivirga aquatica]OEK09665.1 response regulator receiver protein [Flavivirga aquatica]